jgi:hypothetical protein
MHADFQAKKPRTELESLTGYILNEADRLNIDLPRYSQSLRRAFECVVRLKGMNFISIIIAPFFTSKSRIKNRKSRIAFAIPANS